MSAPTATTRARTAQRLLALLRPQRGRAGAAVAAFAAASATEPLIPQLLKRALDDGFLRAGSFPLWMVPVALVGLFALRGGFGYAGHLLLHGVASRLVLQLRCALSAALVRADASLFARLSPGQAVAQVVNDPQTMVTQWSSAALTLLRDGCTAVALLAYLFWLNALLTLLALAVVPLLAWTVRRVHGRLRALGARHLDDQHRLLQRVDDLVRAWRVVRTFGAEAHEARRTAEAAEAVQRGESQAAAASALLTPLSQLLSSLAVAAIVTLALVMGRSGQATVGDFAAYLAALLLLVSRLRHLTDLAQPVVSALVIAEASFALIDTPPEPDQGQHDPGRAAGALALHGVSVRYPGAPRDALVGVDLRIGAGQTVGIVGSSGAGKSTLATALLALLPPSEGRIELDGVDLRAWRKAALRRQFAVVSQDTVLFDDTLAANVAYAAPVDPARIEQCLRAAALWDVVQRLPDGVDTRVGVNGSQLSGGQRQRLAIARALYKDASVWIFDEATSALDSESEHAIQQALHQWHGRRTLIVIAHRLSTLRDADRIVVLDGGRVVEQGSPAVLQALGGRYARLVALQQAPARPLVA